MRKTCLLILIAGISSFSQAQTAKPDSHWVKVKTITKPQPVKPKIIVIPMPEFINQPYYYNKDENNLIRLESKTANMTTKKKGLGLSGARKSFVMESASSKIRFTSARDISFIIKTSGDVIELTSYIKLYKFSTIDDKREVVISSSGGILNAKSEEKNMSIHMGIKKISTDKYMIMFSEPLEAGEYGFVWVNNMELQEFSVFAFGIDWKRSD